MLNEYQQIRTGVISNIAYCGKAVIKRINGYIPENNFELQIKKEFLNLKRL